MVEQLLRFGIPALAMVVALGLSTVIFKKKYSVKKWHAGFGSIIAGGMIFFSIGFLQKTPFDLPVIAIGMILAIFSLALHIAAGRLEADRKAEESMPLNDIGKRAEQTSQKQATPPAPIKEVVNVEKFDPQLLQGICNKCGHAGFEYSFYYDEYSCKNCGWQIDKSLNFEQSDMPKNEPETTSESVAQPQKSQKTQQATKRPYILLSIIILAMALGIIYAIYVLSVAQTGISKVMGIVAIIVLGGGIHTLLRGFRGR
jgi:hypothetical protein